MIDIFYIIGATLIISIIIIGIMISIIYLLKRKG
jgi:hypothetical protein